MAEPAGLAIGIVGLCTVFTSCVELARHVQDARNLGDDYESSITTLMLLEDRLRTCQTKKATRQAQQPLRADSNPSDRELTARALSHISVQLKSINEVLNKYNTQKDQSQSIHTWAETHTLLETRERLEQTSLQRQQSIPMWRKASWAMRDKRELEQAIQVIDKYVCALEKLSEDSASALTVAADTSMATRSPADSRLPASAASIEEALHRQHFGIAASRSGHVYHGNRIRERAHVKQGDVGQNVQVGASAHVYTDNDISADARVHQGNTFGLDMDRFWDD